MMTDDKYEYDYDPDDGYDPYLDEDYYDPYAPPPGACACWCELCGPHGDCEECLGLAYGDDE